MWTFDLFIAFLLIERVKTLTLYSHVGGAVIIKCNYEKSLENNRKYLCKVSGGVCTQKLVSNENTPAEDGKFLLQDNPMDGYFMVLMTQLITEDRGQYACGVDKATPNFITLNVAPHTGSWNSGAIARLSNESAEINCTFTQTYQGRMKYICQRQCLTYPGKLTCHNLTSVTQRRRIQVLPSGSVSVTLEQLTAEDAGEYWCGIEATVGDSITLVSRTLLSIDAELSTATHFCSRPLSPGAALAVSVTAVLLLLGIIAIIVYMLRRRKTSEGSDPSRANISSGRDTRDDRQLAVTEVVYEEISHTRRGPNTVYTISQLPTTPADPTTYSVTRLPTTPSGEATYSNDHSTSYYRDDTYANTSFMTSQTSGVFR